MDQTEAKQGTHAQTKQVKHIIELHMIELHCERYKCNSNSELPLD